MEHKLEINGKTFIINLENIAEQANRLIDQKRPGAALNLLKKSAA